MPLTKPVVLVLGETENEKDIANITASYLSGQSYKFNDEITPTNKNDIGTIAMANSGPNTNGSQFFINVAANNFLDTKHTVFGKITAGLDVAEVINSVPTDEGDRPIEPIILESITLK